MSAFLALWNDVERGREAEYDEWHTREHVPERVAAPGFRGGRRYVDRDHPMHRYFTFYEVEGMECFRSPQYRDLLENPTPWSASMRPSFRNFLRVACVLEHAAGYGIGGALAVLRVTLSGTPDPAHAVAALARGPRMATARLGRAVADGPAPAWVSPKSGSVQPFDAVLVLDALDRDAARAGIEQACELFGVTGEPLDSGGVYDLAFVFPGADAGERLAHRRPAWSS